MPIAVCLWKAKRPECTLSKMRFSAWYRSWYVKLMKTCTLAGSSQCNTAKHSQTTPDQSQLFGAKSQGKHPPTLWSFVLSCSQIALAMTCGCMNFIRTGKCPNFTNSKVANSATTWQFLKKLAWIFRWTTSPVSGIGLIPWQNFLHWVGPTESETSRMFWRSLIALLLPGVIIPHTELIAALIPAIEYGFENIECIGCTWNS